MLHPGIAGFSNVLIRSKDVQEFGPEPFGGIDTADEPEVVGIEGRGVGVDGCGLFDGCMIFPENEECVWVMLESGKEAQGSTGCVHGDRCRTCGVYGNGPDGPGGGWAGLAEAADNGGLEALDVIAGVLAELVVGGIAVEAVFPAGVVKNGGGYFAAVGGVYEQRTNGIGAEVYSNNEIFSSHMAVRIPVKITFKFLF